MTRLLLHVLLVNCILTVCAYSKPMDANAAKKIPGLELVIINMRKASVLSSEEIAFINECIDSKDPVLVAVSSWIAGEYNKTDEQLINKLKNELKTTSSKMTAAFIQIAIDKCAANISGIEWKPEDKLTATDNPYLFIETTRALLLAKDERGNVQLTKMRESDDPFLKAAARSLAKDVNSSTNASRSLLFDERYATVLRIINVPIPDDTVGSDCPIELHASTKFESYEIGDPIPIYLIAKSRQPFKSFEYRIEAPRGILTEITVINPDGDRLIGFSAEKLQFRSSDKWMKLEQSNSLLEDTDLAEVFSEAHTPRNQHGITKKKTLASALFSRWRAHMPQNPLGITKPGTYHVSMTVNMAIRLSGSEEALWDGIVETAPFDFKVISEVDVAH